MPSQGSRWLAPKKTRFISTWLERAEDMNANVVVREPQRILSHELYTGERNATLQPGLQLHIQSLQVTVERLLSQGRFGDVYLVRTDAAVNGTTQHALKRVLVTDHRTLAELKNEVDIMRMLKGHPNIVNLIESSWNHLSDQRYEVFILMELCAGGGIIDMMNRQLRDRLTEREILQIFVAVCEGVAAMHDLKPPFLHRDIRVENVLRANETSYKLCDFGSATVVMKPPTTTVEIRKLANDLNRHTMLQYRAPEMVDLQLKTPIDEKSDVWALGVLLYKLCYYTTPFEEHGPLAILKVQYNTPHHPVYSQGINDMIVSMLREHGTERPTVFEILETVHRMRGTNSQFHYAPQPAIAPAVPCSPTEPKQASGTAVQVRQTALDLIISMEHGRSHVSASGSRAGEDNEGPQARIQRHSNPVPGISALEPRQPQPSSPTFSRHSAASPRPLTLTDFERSFPSTFGEARIEIDSSSEGPKSVITNGLNLRMRNQIGQLWGSYESDSKEKKEIERANRHRGHRGSISDLVNLWESGLPPLSSAGGQQLREGDHQKPSNGDIMNIPASPQDVMIASSASNRVSRLFTSIEDLGGYSSSSGSESEEEMYASWRPRKLFSAQKFKSSYFSANRARPQSLSISPAPYPSIQSPCGSPSVHGSNDGAAPTSRRSSVSDIVSRYEALSVASSPRSGYIAVDDRWTGPEPRAQINTQPSAVRLLAKLSTSPVARSGSFLKTLIARQLSAHGSSSTSSPIEVATSNTQKRIKTNAMANMRASPPLFKPLDSPTGPTQYFNRNSKDKDWVPESYKAPEKRPQLPNPIVGRSASPASSQSGLFDAYDDNLSFSRRPRIKPMDSPSELSFTRSRTSSPVRSPSPTMYRGVGKLIDQWQKKTEEVKDDIDPASSTSRVIRPQPASTATSARQSHFTPTSSRPSQAPRPPSQTNPLGLMVVQKRGSANESKPEPTLQSRIQPQQSAEHDLLLAMPSSPSQLVPTTRRSSLQLDWLMDDDIVPSKSPETSTGSLQPRIPTPVLSRTGTSPLAQSSSPTTYKGIGTLIDQWQKKHGEQDGGVAAEALSSQRKHRPGARHPGSNTTEAKTETDPRGANYLHRIPAVQKADSFKLESSMPSQDEFNLNIPPPGRSENLPVVMPDEQATPHSENEHEQDLREPEGPLTLEQLMEANVPKDLTNEVTIPDYRQSFYGGFAAVYKGVWNGKAVAVKVLKAKKNIKRPAAWEASMERRLLREIRVWASLSHPNITEFLGFANEFADFTAMISTWCHHGTAQEYLTDNESIGKEQRIFLVQDAAHGLAYLHGLKIIHGDLKPTNVLVDEKCVARLCDFGLVRLDDWQGPAGMTTTSPYTGTERYKAPELFASSDNHHPVATSTGDIYALGCIALEFIKSRPPFERCHNSFTLSKAIAEGEAPAKRPRDEPDTDGLWFILEGCWAHYPENRLKVDEVVDELAHFAKQA